MNVAQLLLKAAQNRPSRPAIKYGDASYTYSELGDRVGRLAAGLTEQGVRPGDRVVVWMVNRPQVVETIYATLMAGSVVVPVNPRLHESEVAYILGDSQARVLVLDETYQFQADVPPGVRVLRSNSLPYAGRPLSLVEALPEDLAWLFYTSGTTGRPKAAMLTHRSLLAMTMNCLADVCSFQPEDVVLHAAPLSHGSGLYMLPSLARGALNVILDGSFEPRRVFEAIERERVSIIAFLAPTQIVKLVSDPAVRSHDLSSLQNVIYGGGPMYVEHMKQALALFGQIWVQIYGQGETPMTGTYLRAVDHRTDTEVWEGRLGSIGIPRTDIELRLERLTGGPAPIGEVGEITIRGDEVMKGYWNNPSATADALRDGWLHTGDLAYSDNEGFIYIVDRIKDMIISGGNNIYAREVEEALLTHPEVREVAVIGVPDDYWGEAVHAVVALQAEGAAGAEELIEHCRIRLASYKKPRSIEFVHDLPKNAYGKVLKRELREGFWHGRTRGVGGGHLRSQSDLDLEHGPRGVDF